jgi:GTP-binding protein HflX
MTPIPCLCVGVGTPKADWPVAVSLAELGELATTAGLTVMGYVSQARNAPNRLSYVGSGKLALIRDMIAEQDIAVVICDDELTPNQQRHLENTLQVKILDRTSLVLDIFSQRARTKEAHIQIELAQLRYLQPRLRRMWTHLSRLGGGIGTRGPGETQLEVDRRQIGMRIETLKKMLAKVRVSRDSQRKRRLATGGLTVALMGYTNAGKSTLHHTLTESNVYQENALFATLDPTTRLVKSPLADDILVTDTVGFIRKLPHQLIDAFRSTLEEMMYADIILHIVDCSNPYWRDLMTTAYRVLDHLNITLPQEIVVFNKIDLAPDPVLTRHACKDVSTLFISATDPNSRDRIVQAILQKRPHTNQQMVYRIPYNRMRLYDMIHRNGQVVSVEHTPEAIILTCVIDAVIGAQLMAELHAPLD